MFGDGVNVAARLEALAEPGGIRLSAAAHEQVRDRLALKTACVARRTRQPDRAPSARGVPGHQRPDFVRAGLR